MKLLGNFDVFKEYYDIDKKQVLFFESLQDTVGIYKFIEDKLTGLLVDNNNLFFLNGDDRFLITKDCQVLIKKYNEKQNEFNLLREGSLLVKFLYPLPNKELNVSPFEYIDDVDFKWGDFIEKIVNNENRKRSFIENLGGN